MKLLCTVFVVLAIVGAAVGDGEPVCDVELPSNHTSDDMADALIDRMMTCVHDIAKDLRNNIRAANTSEEYRDAFRTACAEIPTTNECTSGVVVQAGICLNETMARTFEVVRQDMHTVLNVFCENDGQKMAEVIIEVAVLKNHTDSHTFFDECVNEGTKGIEGLDEYEASPISVAYYKTFRSIKQCMARHGEGHANLITLINSVFDQILTHLKCVHPESQAEVLCESFVTAE